MTVPGTRVGRDAEQLVVAPPEGAEEVRVPVRTVSALVVHGGVQVSSQAMALCVHHAIGVHWFTAGGRYVGGLGGSGGNVQRRLRQFEALRRPERVLSQGNQARRRSISRIIPV
ncbi:CRISPR-associated endonuclease Cas1 [Stigmatella erecta]|uniref:CRISP-associated protein Cas1 n=1 Tax=Stigmatella erecta TaxID=83460 RepID=A0A1I0KDB2_9BACT|nr:CRISPR-associated endonuclease Cas1 [Stigmatella erecta]SEU22262.1 CRISP-associated protein Cas1 [Stigmatella erecta]